MTNKTKHIISLRCTKVFLQIETHISSYSSGSNSSAPRMHFAPTTPQAFAATAILASMETGATVSLMVRAKTSKLIAQFGCCLIPNAAPPGAPQRVSGKVSGTVSVQSTPVPLNNIDLHAYIVVGDGRAYSAISEVVSFRRRTFSGKLSSGYHCTVNAFS